MLVTGNLRDVRPAPGGDQDVPSRDLPGRAVAVDVNRVRIDQPGMTVGHLHPAAHEQLLVHAVESCDLRTAVLLELRPVECRCRPLPAEAVRFLEGLGVVGRVAVELLGDAADVYAGSAEVRRAAGLDQRHAGAAIRGHARRADPAAAPADDEQVSVEYCSPGAHFEAPVAANFSS